jgi:ribose transport system permease protein
MMRILGALGIVLVLYSLILASDSSARSLENHQRLAERESLYGMMTIGVGILIISGGIDLSIGSVCALAAVGLGVMLTKSFGIFGGPVPPALAIIIVLVGAGLIGLFHGLLVTKLRLQPFIVTLCGLFIYRGFAYWLAIPEPLVPVKRILRDLVQVFTGKELFQGESLVNTSARNVGIGERSGELQKLIFFSTGYPKFGSLVDRPVVGWFFRMLQDVPIRFWLLCIVAILATVFLHFSVYGRYVYAVGSNEQAARYAGVPAARYKIIPYIICSMLAALTGILEFLDLQTASPSTTGTWYELYAITGAVLGGCSLRGGEGTVIGMLLGTAVLPLLRNVINFWQIPDDLTFMVIGFALLLGTIADQLLGRVRWRRGITAVVKT